MKCSLNSHSSIFDPFFFFETIPYSVGSPETHHVDDDGLEFVMLMPHPPECYVTAMKYHACFPCLVLGNLRSSAY